MEENTKANGIMGNSMEMAFISILQVHGKVNGSMEKG